METYEIPISVEGHVLITDLDTGQVLCSARNAIHSENMGYAISQALVAGNIISEIHFGNGGTLLSEGDIIFRPANITGKDAELYNPIYYRVVDALDYENSDPSNNKTEIRHINGTTYTDIVVTTTLDYDDPDDINGTGGGFVKSLSTAALEDQANDGAMRFDEIGLKSRGTNGLDSGRLLTHFRFHPIQKTNEQRIQIVYTLRVRA